ncbi:MAG: response regulator [Candidatus Limnocylindrales bacterium]|jgi:DNA-binding NtrC family response regulator
MSEGKLDFAGILAAITPAGATSFLDQVQASNPVVVVTGQGTVDTAIKALREGASGMLVKPFTSEELLGEVRRALAASQMRYEALQYRYLSPVLDSISLTLSTAIEARNLETGEHCRQLGVLSERMAAVLGRAPAAGAYLEGVRLSGFVGSG